MSKERSTQFERFYLKACEMIMMEKIATGNDLPMIDPANTAKAAMTLAVEMQQCYLEKKFDDERWWAENEDEMKAMWEQAQIEKWAGIAKEKAQ
jgi:hypothetical protein